MEWLFHQLPTMRISWAGITLSIRPLYATRHPNDSSIRPFVWNEQTFMVLSQTHHGPVPPRLRETLDGPGVWQVPDDALPGRVGCGHDLQNLPVPNMHALPSPPPPPHPPMRCMRSWAPSWTPSWVPWVVVSALGTDVGAIVRVEIMSLHDEPVVSSTPDSSMQSVCHTCVTGRRGKELDLTGRIYAADTTAPRHTTTAPMTAPMTAPTASTKASAMVPTTACISFGVGGRVVGGMGLGSACTWELEDVVDQGRGRRVPGQQRPVLATLQDRRASPVAVIGMTSCTQWPDGEGNASP
jgi:hypothetical protein